MMEKLQEMIIRFYRNTLIGSNSSAPINASRVREVFDLNIDSCIDEIDLEILDLVLESENDITLPFIHGDTNENGILDENDFTQGYWAPSVITREFLLRCDWNHDGVLDKKDQLMQRRQDNLGIYFYPLTSEFWGDVNGDGKVNGEDIQILNSVIDNNLELSDNYRLFGDVDLNGSINEKDIYLINLYRCDRINRNNLPIIGTELDLTVCNVTEDGIVIYDNFDDINEAMSVNTFRSRFLSNYNPVVPIVFKDIYGNVINSNDSVGTGTTIEFTDGGSARLVIYGDTTGDGLINAVDALALIKHINKHVVFESDIFEKAGCAMGDNKYRKPTAVDALAIIKSANDKYDIPQQSQLPEYYLEDFEIIPTPNPDSGNNTANTVPNYNNTVNNIVNNVTGGI